MSDHPHAQPEPGTLTARLRQTAIAVLVLVFPVTVAVTAIILGARACWALLSGVRRASWPVDWSTGHQGAYPSFLTDRFLDEVKRIPDDSWERIRRELDRTQQWQEDHLGHRILLPVRAGYRCGWLLAMTTVFAAIAVAVILQVVVGVLLMGLQKSAVLGARAADAFAGYLRDIRVVCPHESCWQLLTHVDVVCPNPPHDLHEHLVPDSDGVLWHVCAGCGGRLPTLILRGRHRLTQRCPECHRDLPQRTGRVPIEPLPIVAGPAAGKTTFLTRALEELIVDPPDGTAVSIPDAQQLAQHEQRLRELRADATAPTQTRMPSGVVVDVRHAGGGGRIITLFDAAGEHFTSAERAARLGYLQHIRALLVIVDPETMRGLGDALAGARSGARRAGGDAARAVLDAVGRLGGEGRPVVLDRAAVVVTKGDLLKQSGLDRPDGNYDTREWLKLNGMGSLVGTMDNAASTTRYKTTDWSSDPSHRGELLLWLAGAAAPARRGRSRKVKPSDPAPKIPRGNTGRAPLGHRIGHITMIISYVVGAAAVPTGVAALVWWAVSAI